MIYTPAIPAAEPRILRYLKWLLAALVLGVLLWPYLYCLGAIGYNYAWWLLRSQAVVQEANPAQLPTLSSLEPPVPRILHQTWKTQEIPDKWKAAQQSCIDAHPGYEYKLWTDEDALDLICSKFPWFVDTYINYQYDIQRADALRYFVLYEYGGIYLDLDVQCLKSLDFLRSYNFTAPKTYPVGVSNDVMVSRPRDVFAHRLIRNLQAWNRWFFVKYATVMFSTGPMFVTVQFALHKHKGDVAVLPASLYGKYDGSDEAYLTHLHGSSWHGKDASFVFFMEHNGVYLAAIVLLVLFTAALCVHLLRCLAKTRGLKASRVSSKQFMEVP